MGWTFHCNCHGIYASSVAPEQITQRLTVFILHCAIVSTGFHCAVAVALGSKEFWTCPCVTNHGGRWLDLGRIAWISAQIAGVGCCAIETAQLIHAFLIVGTNSREAWNGVNLNTPSSLKTSAYEFFSFIFHILLIPHFPLLLGGIGANANEIIICVRTHHQVGSIPTAVARFAFSSVAGEIERTSRTMIPCFQLSFFLGFLNFGCSAIRDVEVLSRTFFSLNHRHILYGEIVHRCRTLCKCGRCSACGKCH